MRRDLEQAKRLELGLIKVRWLLIAYGLVQTFVERVDPNAPSYAFELGLVLTVGMLLSNLFFTQFVQQARRPSDLHWVGAVAFLLDTVVILEWVWVAAAKPSDPAWVMAYLLPIEGAMRYGILGAFAPLPVLLISEIAREMYLSEEFPSYHFVGPAVAFRVGMAAVIALVAGVFASSLRKESELAAERTAAAEEARPARRGRRQTRSRGSPRPVRVPHGDPGGGGVGGSRAGDPGDRRGGRTRDGVRLARRVAPRDDRRRGGARRGGRLRRPRVPARHPVRRGERTVRVRARARAPEPAARSRGGRGPAACPGRRDRHPARARQRGRVDRSRSAAPARPTGGSGLAGRAGRPAARQAGGDAHPSARARRAQVGLRRHHEPRAPHAAHGRSRVRRRAPTPARRALRRGGAGVPHDHPRPDGPVDPPGRGPAAHLPDRGRQAHVHAAPGEHGQPAHRSVPGTG